MATIMPQTELVKRALVFIVEKQRDNPDIKIHALMDEAGMRFNLSPAEARALEKLCRENNTTRKN